MNTRRDNGAQDRRTLTIIALAAAAATVAAFLPHLFLDSDVYASHPAVLVGVWIALLVLLGPVAAAAAAWRGPVVTRAPRALLVGGPQVLVVALLVRWDVWSEVRSGYLLAGSGEEAMAYGLAGTAGVVAGVVLALLVASSSAVATSLVRRRQQQRLPTDAPA